MTQIHKTNFCSGADQRKHQSFASLAFVRGIHRWPMDSPHTGPITVFPFIQTTSPVPKMFLFDDVIMTKDAPDLVHNIKHSAVYRVWSGMYNIKNWPCCNVTRLESLLLYGAVITRSIFLQNSRKMHTIARPFADSISELYSAPPPPPPLQWYMQYLVILDCIVMSLRILKLNCIHAEYWVSN